MIADIFDFETFETRLRRMADGYAKRFGSLLKYDVEEEITRFKGYVEVLGPFIIDEIPTLSSAKAQKLNVIVEGAQATMLDISYGTYPFVTSSHCTVGGMLAGVSLGWQSIKEVIGVVKAYSKSLASTTTLTV
jgi:adenylosuccinate synthase